MGDENRSAIAHDGSITLGHDPFRNRVESGGRFVQDQHRGIREERARESNTLPFAGRQCPPSFTDQRVVAVRQCVHEFRQTRRFHGSPDFVQCRRWPDIPNVLKE